MAEASPQPGRYFCHCCSVEIVPRLPVRSGREGGGAVRARRARGEAETRWRASSVAGRSEDPGLRRGGPSAGRVALVGLSGDRDAELRAGDGRRARGQDAGTRSAASSAAPGLAAAPIEATNPTPQSGGGVWSGRTDTPPGCNRPCATASMWLWPAAPLPGCPQASCCYLVALGRCIPRTPPEYLQASWFFKVALGVCTPRTLLRYLGASCIQFRVVLAVPPRVFANLLRVIDYFCVWYQPDLPFTQVCLCKPWWVALRFPGQHPPNIPHPHHPLSHT